MPALLSNWKKRLLDNSFPAWRALFASDCPLCDARTAGHALCDDCWIGLPWLPAPGCRNCAHPLPLPGLCGRCLTDPPHFDRVIAATRYGFPVDGLIQACKYGGRLSIVPALAEILKKQTPQSADLIVPMPLSPMRLRERGFNQALELARAAGSALEAPVDAALCVKSRETPPQTRLPWKQRRKNIRGAFVVLGDVTGLDIVVVDDVLTSGATMNELARNLKRAGAASVTGWVVARTVAADGYPV